MFKKVTLQGKFDPAKANNRMDMLRTLGILCPAMTALDKSKIMHELEHNNREVVLCIITEESPEKKVVFVTKQDNLHKFTEQCKALDIDVTIE